VSKIGMDMMQEAFVVSVFAKKCLTPDPLEAQTFASGSVSYYFGLSENLAKHQTPFTGELPDNGRVMLR
jgi:hypothetical protein